MFALDLILNSDGADGEPSSLIHRVIFEQVLFSLVSEKVSIERREPDRYFYLVGRLGMAIEIDTDEGERFGSIYIAVSDKNPAEASRHALAIARHLAENLGLKPINPVEGILYDPESLPEFPLL